MKQYILKIKPISPFLTPVESDTLFGHICWAMEYLERFSRGKTLTDFLEKFDGQTPPLILSGAFLEGYIPFPLLPPFKVDEMKKLEELFIDRGRGDKFDFIQWLKELSRRRFFAVEDFLRYRWEFSKYDIYTRLLEEGVKTPGFTSGEENSETVEVYHNAVNRITGTVEEGALFSTNPVFYRENVCLDVYIKTGYFTAEELEEIFGFFSLNGFGADKSTGSGRFEFELKEGTPFGDTGECNAWLLLSNTHPSVLKEFDACYATQTKFGKLGGLFSTNARYSPFKNPVILLRPGSVIYSSRSVEYCGENFKGIHPQLPAVQHYGIGFPVQMRLKDDK
jgi:CRISPR-associated protein Csm4